MKTRVFLITALIISLSIGAFTSWQFLHLVNPMRLASSSINPFVFIFVISLSLTLQIIGHLLRSQKHGLLLRQIRPTPFAEVFKGQMIGFLFNALLPLRIGELIRAHYIGRGVRISRSAVFGTILFERIIDLGIILALSLLAVILLGDGGNHILLSTLLIMMVSFIVLLVIVWTARTQNSHLLRIIFITTSIFADKIKNRLRLMAWSFIFGLKTVINRQVMPQYLWISILMWACYFISTAIICMLFFGSSIQGVVAGSIAPYIAASTPVGPTYLVNFSLVLQSVFPSLSQNLVPTLLYTLITWIALVLPSVTLGAIFVIRRHVIPDTPALSSFEVMKNKLYRDSDISNEFGGFLDTYFKGTELHRILNNNEIANNYTVVKTFKGGSNALTLLAWQNDAMVVKKISINQYADKLAAQYAWLNERRHLPQIARTIGEKYDRDHYSLDLEYRDDYITYFDYIHSSSKADAWHVLQNVIIFMQKHIYSAISIDDQPEKVSEYIEKKIIGKVRDAANTSVYISQALEHKNLIVNGRKLRNFNTVIKEIQRNPTIFNDLCDFGESPIHGDLTVDNIIVNPATREFLLLDPNNENAISDAVTDYGKLFQSLHSGYEFMVLTQQASLAGNKITFEEKTSAQYNYLYQKLSAYLKKELTSSQYRSILFHEAVHYCRMLTYRVHINPNNAVAFYAIAVRLFNDFLEQYDE